MNLLKIIINFLQILFYFFKRKIIDYYCKSKYLLQKLFRGYSDEELWSLDLTLSKIILKYLKAYKSYKRMGFPADPKEEMTKEKWEEILDEIIWGFDFAVNDYVMSDEYYNVIFKDGFYNKKEYNKLQKKYNNSMKLFAKYFDRLWD